MLQALRGFSGGKLPRRSKVEEGRDEEEEEEEGQEKKMEYKVMKEILATVPGEADAVGVVSLGILYQQPKTLKMILSVSLGSE